MLANNLPVLRASRGNLKGSLTKLATFSEKINELITIDALEVRLEKLEDLWEKFYSSQQQMYTFGEEEGYVDPEPEFEEFESKYLLVKSVFISSIREKKKPESNTAQANPPTNSQAPIVQQLGTSSAVSYINDHLPMIRIEPFSGSYRDWPAFRDMYESSVHNKPSLSPTQKFHLLRYSLRGEALNLLSHIPLSDATYEQAWERLEKRYDRPRYIVNSLLETFIQLPSLHISNVRSLRKISDCADEVLRGLNSLNSFERDPWMIYALVSKVDPGTRQAWSADSVDTDYPTIDQFLTFLERRCEALESCKTHVREPNKKNTALHVASSNQCSKCNSAHALPQCPDFLALDLESKRDFVKSKKLCFNCLRSGHSAVRCQSKFRCRTCNSRHHSLVHLGATNANNNHSLSETTTSLHCDLSNSNFPSSSSNSNLPSSAFNSNRPSSSFNVNLPSSSSSNSNLPSSSSNRPSSSSHLSQLVTHHSINFAQFRPQTLLPTAVCKVLDSSGNYQLIRLLIDSGSQVSFVTESCVQRLGLRRTNARIPISGISETCAGTSRGLVSMVIASRFDSVSITVDTYILSNLTAALPSNPFDINDWDHIKNLNLADPSFNQPSSVDMLLGADKAWDILQGEIVRGTNGHPIAQSTIFGWVLAGRMVSDGEQNIRSHHTIIDIDSALQAFWTIEEVDPKLIVSTEDKVIEDHFVRTHRRSADGKYIVKLPFKRPPVFANTLNGAVSRLSAMERKFTKNNSLFRSYSKFMEEYLTLGHMRKIPSSEISKPNIFYLPHHAVLKPDSATTKLRVVFDGSFKDTRGNSLNDSLLIGPPIQRNLFSVCLRFRRHKYVFTADIVKMFRQVWVSDEDTDYQRIVWRKSQTDPIDHYRLCTVTYGTSCAPYISVRVLEQLARDYREEYPVASEILLNDFYVDDVVSGGDSLADAMSKKKCLTELLAKGGLKLSKWQSNCKELIEEEELLQSKDISFDSGVDPWVKVLGLYWNSELDYFSFRLNLTPSESVTKRQLLREVARMFDPLGFLAPSIVQLKIILQELWHRKLSWDEPLPDSIVSQWRNYRLEFSELTNVCIPRCIGIVDTSFQLHGFSDASASAYAAVIYSRHTLPDGTIKTIIVAAKSRVAPIKQLSIPRLELCGALLLSRLLVAVQRSLNTTFANVFAWCDSQVVLSWLSSPPRRWDIFVGNRTSEILSAIPRNRWFHIRSEQNPADCASRGIAPSVLVQHPIWWKGPHWLAKKENYWPVGNYFEEHPDCQLEEKRQCKNLCLVVNVEHPFHILFPRVSSWNRLIRVVAYVLRFVSICRKLSHKTTLQLRPQEIYNAKRNIIIWLQHLYFGDDITYFKKHHHFSKRSKIANLSPFIDDQQILRVGGRIQEADVSFNVKHPIILPKGHAVTQLIAIDFHQRLLHPGVSALFVLIRQEYWIIGCRNLLRKITHECIKCFRQRKTTATQIMGNLPAQRIQPSRPFLHCGCDYAGPILLRTKSGRKIQHTKGYISLFVCLSTKAIHLELVSDLTTVAFLAALRRFIARRGKPSHMYSDNGTNFRGSAKRLSEMHQITMSEHHNSLVAESLARDAITWHFIPPSAPHFGGLWEAGVKSIKQHIRRVIGSDILNFEEFYTLLTQIEALLNCRPLCRTSDNDLDPLTPAHFIIGESYSAVPEPSLEIPQHRLSSWQALQTKVQGFWKRWSMEYLTSLQQRPRWSQPQRDLQLNDLVVIKDSNLPPGKWAIGRIIAIHPGKDGHIRVVTLRTGSGNLIRPIHKLAPLPIC